MTTNLLENGEVVLSLQRNILHGGQDLNTLPGLVCRLLREEMWRERVIPQTRQMKTYGEFAEFVADPPPEGLDTDVDTLKRLCGASTAPLAVEALALIDEETQGEHGGDRGNQHTGGKIANSNLAGGTDGGTTRQYAVRRLRKSRPDLHAQVIAGEKSPHAAMVEAGFRRRMLNIPAEPSAAAAALRRHFHGAEWEQLIAALEKCAQLRT